MKKLLFVGLIAAGMSVSADVPYQFGVAGYSFKARSLDDSLAIMKKAGVRNLCVKDFHLRYDASDAEIAAFKAKCAKAGVEPYALGPLYTKDVASTRAYFEFAKRYGAKLIVGVPYEPGDARDTGSKRRASTKLLAEIDSLVKEFDIRYAIHNHGPAAPEMFSDVAGSMALVKDLDARIGFCLDVGWEAAAGRDPAKTVRDCADRIFDVHLKDFAIGKPDGAAIPLGRGRLELRPFLQALADVGYSGVCSIEYETDFANNAAAIAECAGYCRGVAACIRPKPVMMPAPADANTLSAAEQAEGWELLWDGKTSAGWVSAKDIARFPKKGWVMKDGTLTMRPVNGITESGKWFPLPPEDRKLGGGGDIVTARKFRDFDFRFDFRLTVASNSGIKYFIDENQNGGTAEEYQLLDAAHPDFNLGRDGNRKTASLYDVYPSRADAYLKPAGRWNTGRIIAKGTHVEHWLNGVKVVEYERGTPAFREAVKLSKYADWGKTEDGKPQPWGEVAEGRILLQDHSDSTVSFCNLKIKVL